MLLFPIHGVAAIGAVLLLFLVGCTTNESKFAAGLPLWKGHDSDQLVRRFGPPVSQVKLNNGNSIWRYRFADDECQANFEVSPAGKIEAVIPVILEDCHKGDISNPYFDEWTEALRKWKGRPTDDLIARIGEPKSRVLAQSPQDGRQEWVFEVGAPTCVLLGYVYPNKPPLVVHELRAKNLAGCPAPAMLE